MQAVSQILSVPKCQCLFW